MGVLWNMDTFLYASDSGVDKTVGLSTLVAAVGGFTATAGLIDFPRGWKMRRVYGVNATGSHASVPIAHNGDGLYTGSTATFTIHSSTYDCQGRIGEKRRVRI